MGNSSYYLWHIKDDIKCSGAFVGGLGVNSLGKVLNGLQISYKMRHINNMWLFINEAWEHPPAIRSHILKNDKNRTDFHQSRHFTSHPVNPRIRIAALLARHKLGMRCSTLFLWGIRQTAINDVANDAKGVRASKAILQFKWTFATVFFTAKVMAFMCEKVTEPHRRARRSTSNLTAQTQNGGT